MYCKQEYFSSDNIITTVTTLVCALTVTKYVLITLTNSFENAASNIKL